MPLALKRLSLSHQVAEVVRAEILRGAWLDWIPSERSLSRTLHVSRNTCSNALQALCREGLIEVVVGRGLRITRRLARQADDAAASRSVGILLPDAINRLRPAVSLFVDELKDELFDSGTRTQLHCSAAFYNAHPAGALKRLVEQNHHDCWILLFSRKPLQSWFAEQKLPCVVSGSTHPGIRLPSVDWDNRATCRHAAGTLIGLGHRRLAFFNRASRAGGDLESEQGFKEACQQTRSLGVVGSVVYHEDERESVVRLVDNLFSCAQPPTGILVANSHCYLSVGSALARRGLRIPQDISLISRDDDFFLGYIEPDPARYLADPSIWVHKIMHALRRLLEGREAKLQPIRIMPRFISGHSLQEI